MDHFPTYAKRVIVGGLASLDLDSDWGVQFTMFVSAVIEDAGNVDVVCRGRVLLHMNDDERSKPEHSMRTAYLLKDEFISVFMSECSSPCLFYVQRVAFTRSLDKLENDITEWITKEHTFTSHFMPKVGEVILV